MGKFLTSPVGSFLRVVLGFVLGALTVFLAEGGTFADLTWGDFQLWLGAAVAGALPILIAWVNPDDTRFGAGAG